MAKKIINTIKKNRKRRQKLIKDVIDRGQSQANRRITSTERVLDKVDNPPMIPRRTITYTFEPGSSISDVTFRPHLITPHQLSKPIHLPPLIHVNPRPPVQLTDSGVDHRRTSHRLPPDRFTQQPRRRCTAHRTSGSAAGPAPTW